MYIVHVGLGLQR